MLAYNLDLTLRSTAMTADIDVEALGFTLTIGDAAKVLDTTPDQIRDLIRTRVVTYIVASDMTGQRQAIIRFHPGALAAYKAIKLRGDMPADRANAVRVARYLREYLEELEPEDEYEQAVFKRTPMMVSLKRGPRVAISIGSFVEHMQEYAGVTLVPSVVEDALQRIGAVAKRGVIPYGERGGKQRWATWWIVPNSMLSGVAENDDQLLADVHGASLDTGEPVHRSRELPRGGDGRISGPVGRPMLDGVLGAEG
jgi:hypothetical protein